MSITSRVIKATLAPLRLSVCALAILLAGACSEKQEPYPDLVTEFADIRTSASGLIVDMTIDDGTRFTISNTNIKPHRPDTTYRAVVGYVPNGAALYPEAHIYSLMGARVLADSSGVARHDPTGIESMWKRGRYINMQLTAKGQGGVHHWGYAVDSIRCGDEEGREHSHYHLSIHHNQGQAPLSYSQTYYCSIAYGALAGFGDADTVSVSVNTFRGMKTWTFIGIAE